MSNPHVYQVVVLMPGMSPHELSSSGARLAFEESVERELLGLQQEIVEAAASVAAVAETHLSSYDRAREVVNTFRPAPQFVWRVCNFALATPGTINPLTDGQLFGLKKLVLDIGADSTLGHAGSPSSMREVTEKVSGDVIAAAVAMHALIRRLHTRTHRALWAPILDEALLRAHIGYFVGALELTFGSGRGMLAGFASRVGMAVLIGSATEAQAKAARAALASGQSLEEISLQLFGTLPAHVAAMALSALGCGRDAVLGIGSFGLSTIQQAKLPVEAQRWLAAFEIVDDLRSNRSEQTLEEKWRQLGFTSSAERSELRAIAERAHRIGHGWEWMK